MLIESSSLSATATPALFDMHLTSTPSALRAAVTAAYRCDERTAVQWLLAQAEVAEAAQPALQELARRLVTTVRAQRRQAGGVDALMHEFSLSSDEGIALMCLAEALLRIPDAATADRLIADKISKGDWRKHLGASPSMFVNAASWGLLITGKLMHSHSESGLGAALGKMIAKGGEPLIRKGVDLAMRMLGNQFVTGRTIEEALDNSREREARGYRFSYDMLGEAALTAEDAQRYFAAYEHALHTIGQAAHGRGIKDGPGISVKLSALHPRYAHAQRTRVMQELLPRLQQLLRLAKQYDIGLNIDAEEADRLELSLDLLEALAFDPELAGFDGLGFVVQAYQKRCPFVIDYLADLARRSQRKFMVRLVKGAYWDAEIKRAQVEGLPGYPVYTRKAYTDVSYLVCAQKLLAHSEVLYPQFATHNAHTLSAILVWAQARGIADYEFQCLHGMGETLYDQVVGAEGLDRPCRIYAPVGAHETLLAYLVRRLLENGANSSFVNQIVDAAIPIDTLIADPFEKARQWQGAPHPQIPLPAALFAPERVNSAGLDLSNDETLRSIACALPQFSVQQWQAAPLLADGHGTRGPVVTICDPADTRDTVGYVIEATADDVQRALAAAHAYAPQWQAVAPAERAAALLRAADLLEMQRLELLALAIREAGKSLPNAIAEVREAVDFLRYYASQLPSLPPVDALGPVVCISPWNFPLAIFIGEVSAALAAGNVVLAKPAEQTPLIAYRAVQLLHEAGIPRSALQLLPGRGETVGAALTRDHRMRGILFTGSTDVAQAIARTLAKRHLDEGGEVVLIAETGGQNAMIVDSSALPEQVVQDVLLSAFDSAGQRCSALRVLCLQEDIADKTLTMLQRAMQQLKIGLPGHLDTDVGPVIDAQAQQQLQQHIEQMRTRGATVYQVPLPQECAHGTFVAPTLIEIHALAQLQREVFGPVLHVLRYRRDALPQLVQAINDTGYGLTLGIHSRIDETVEQVIAQARVGNIYVNRNIVGAVVGVQPFGGEGKSGTGPKAGGPLYLKRLLAQQHGERLEGKRAGNRRISDQTSERRNAGQRIAAHRVPASVAAAQTALHDLIAWGLLHAPETTTEVAQAYRHRTLLHTVIALPGPTGERNTLSFAPRGTVLCVAADSDLLLNQLAAAFATGNRVIIDAATAEFLAADMPYSVRCAITIVPRHAWSRYPIDVALLDATQSSDWALELAERAGALLPWIATTATSPVPLWRLVTERAVCVNTSAAGGNASLMMLGA